jgi:hypothetical protein
MRRRTVKGNWWCQLDPETGEIKGVCFADHNQTRQMAAVVKEARGCNLREIGNWFAGPKGQHRGWLSVYWVEPE